MIDAFVEGARSVVQACHLVILFPVAMLVVAGRARWQVVAGAVLGIVVGGWVFMTRWFVLDDTQIRWSSLVVIAATLGVGVPHLLRTRGHVASDEPEPEPAEETTQADNEHASAATGRAEPWIAGGITGAVALLVTTWWRPCVGEELGDILTAAPRAPWEQLLPSVGFMLGVSLPIVLLGLAIASWQPSVRTSSRLAVGAISIGVILSLSVLAGQHGEIVATLFDWSEPFV